MRSFLKNTTDNIMRPEEKKFLIEEAKKIALAGAHQVVGDSYGVKHFILPVFLIVMNNDTKHTAAYGSLITLLNVVTITGISTIFQVPSKMASLFSDFNSAPDGQKDEVRQKIISLLRNSCLYSTAVIPLGLPLYFSENILTLLGQPKEVAAIAQSFLRPYSSFLIPTTFMFTFSGMMIGKGDASFFRYGAALTALSILGCTSFFMYQSSFNTRQNALLGFYITEAYSVALLYAARIFFHAQYNDLKLNENFFKKPFFDSEAFLLFLKDGLFSTVRVGCDFLFPFLITILCAQLSKDPEESQAAFTLALWPQIFNNLINCFFALASGKSLSDAKDDKKISANLFRKITYTGIAVTATVSSLIPTTFALFPRAPAIIFGNSNSSVLNSLYKISKPIALSSWLDAFCFTLMLQGQSGWNDFLIGSIARFTGLIVGLLAAAFLAFTVNMGAEGLAWGFPIAMIPTLFLLGRDHSNGIDHIASEKETKRHRWDFYQEQIENRGAQPAEMAVVTMGESV